MSDNVKEIIYNSAKAVMPDKLFDFCWNKYYISNVKRNCTQISKDSYYVKNKSGLQGMDYCIFRFGPGMGIFAIANKMIFYYEWAVANNFIPLVDSEYDEDFLEGKFGENNFWEYCFQQPESLGAAFEKGNVLVSGINGGNILKSTCKKINSNSNDSCIHATSQGYREYYARLHEISQKAWKFRPEVEQKIERTVNELLKPDMRVIGVVLREEFGMNDAEMTEEQRLVYKSHPKALSLEETYELIVKYMEKWNCTHVLITTMFQESLEYFKNKLGSKVIFTQRKRKSFNEFKKINAKSCEDIIHNKGDNLKELHRNSGSDIAERKERMVNYVVEMGTIAKCNYCMGVKCSGLIGACILNGGRYEDIYVFEDRNEAQRY